MKLIFFFQVHCNHQYTVEDEKQIDKELEELEKKVKAVSTLEIIHHDFIQ